MRARRIAGLAEVARKRRVQHVLDQRRLARAGHAGDGHQVLQRELDAHVAQVVVARALDDQPGCGRSDESREAAADLLAPAEVGAGQCVGVADGLRCAVEDDLSTALAGAGAHVDQPVGGEHHGRVVFHDDQRVAGVAQAVHRLDDAVHVARVQADAGLVEHEHRVDQRGAERGGQVDALHLSAAQRAALPVQREVAEADIAEVLQPRADLVDQQLQCVVEHRARQRQAVEEAPDALDRQQHQVVHRQAGQRFQLLARPGHAIRQRAQGRRHHRIGVALGAKPPQQRFGLQPRAAAGAAGRVAAVLRQEHADVHLVGLALQVLEEALDAVPLLVPVALPLRRAVDDEVALRFIELRPRRVARDAGLAGVLQHVLLRVFPGRGHQGLDCTRAQRLAVVGDHQVVVDPDHAAEAAAGVARAHRRVEAEQRRLRIGVAQVAVGAVQAGGEAPEGGFTLFSQHVDVETTTAALERHFDRLDGTHLFRALNSESIGHHVEHTYGPHTCG